MDEDLPRCCVCDDPCSPVVICVDEDIPEYVCSVDCEATWQNENLLEPER